jgi:hypothetical protein
MSKIDIADGFYQIWVRAADVPKLGIMFPSRPGDDTLVSFPLALPMNWKEDPKIFTAATETVADLSNQQLANGSLQPAHHLDAASEQTPPQPELPLFTLEVALLGLGPLLKRRRTIGMHYHRSVGLEGDPFLDGGGDGPTGRWFFPLSPISSQGWS